MFIIQLMIGIIASVGIGYILCDVLKVPSMKAAKTARNAASKGEKKKSSLAVFLDGFAEEIQDKIKLNQWKEQEIQTDLDAAGIKDEPRLFVAKALTKACAVGILVIPAFFIFKILGLAVLAFAVFVYFNETKGITRKIKKKRTKIEAELPRFVSFVNNKLSHTRDLISILRSYMEVKINKEIKEYNETMFFGLSVRQFIFAVLACGAAVGIYFGCRSFMGTETLSWVCMLGAAPFAALGFIKYNGMTAEKIAKAWIRSEILMPKKILFGGTNKLMKSEDKRK